MVKTFLSALGWKARGPQLKQDLVYFGLSLKRSNANWFTVFDDVILTKLERKLTVEQCNALGERKDMVYLFKEYIEREVKKGLPTMPDGYHGRMGEDEEGDEEEAVMEVDVAVGEVESDEEVPVLDDDVAAAEEVYHMEVVGEEESDDDVAVVEEEEVAVAAWWEGVDYQPRVLLERIHIQPPVPQRQRRSWMSIPEMVYYFHFGFSYSKRNGRTGDKEDDHLCIGSGAGGASDYREH